ncbi:MAG TPA: hypothetical protein VHT28_00305 [Silvibacterium sp.]|nr:hypothetical protein [Silvibacterium sp.]
MQTSYTDNWLWGLASAGEVVLLCILLFRRTYRTFPLFTAWIAFSALSEPLYYFLIRHADSRTYLNVDFTQSLMLAALELCVLLEIAINVMAPAKRSLPKMLFAVFAVAIIAVGIGGFFFAAHANEATLAHPRTIFVVNNTVAILRLVAFLLIAGFAQILGLGWKNHVLQVASGLAFYAAVSLITTLLQNRMHGGPSYYLEYHSMQQLAAASYLCALYYWCYSFARQEAPRKEFSPQMTQLLVSISGSTKRQSVAARSIDINSR